MVEARLQSLNLEPLECGSGGNCVFHCIAQQVFNGNNKRDQECRDAVCDWYLQEDVRKEIDGFVAGIIDGLVKAGRLDQGSGYEDYGEYIRLFLAPGCGRKLMIDEFD